MADPYPIYERLLADQPFFDDSLHGWVFARHADVRQVLRDPRFSRHGFRDRLESAIGDGPLARCLGQWMLFRDPPDHTRLRGLVSRAFTPAAVSRLRRQIQGLVDELLDPAEARGGFDLIVDFAHPLPVRVICVLLGVPVADRPKFGEWSEALAEGLDVISKPHPDTIPRGNAAAAGLGEYFQDLVEARRTRPRADLLSDLIAARDGDDRLTEDELLTSCALLFFAGHETTVNLIGNGMLALLRHPDQLGRMRQDPALVHGALDELLRYDSPVQRTGRTAEESVELGGRRIEAGQQLLLLIGAANRDPRRFGEADRLDVQRSNAQQHLSFGAGIHYCVGAPLARMEAEIAIATLLRRIDHPQLVEGPRQWRATFALRGLRSLPMIFNPAGGGSTPGQAA
ncbi:MAG: cytochrome P450 [Chloroflexi bacterium]|nr:cytochrome P450 [Chloroflexota bacterium]